jgi:Ca2+/Na+ antiporter
MRWAALATWVLTAGGGSALLGIWLKRGGVQQRTLTGARIRPVLIFTHFALAATSLVIWIIYLAIDRDVLAWVAFALLLVVALLGFTMLAIWLQRRQRTPVTATAANVAAGERPAEQHFPVSIVTLHGLLAATTLVLAALAAAGVGESS